MMRINVAQYCEQNGGELPAFAWPGGYPLVYVTGEGDTLCEKCAMDETRVTVSTHLEGPPEVCDGCGKSIESAYGDPDADEEVS